MVFNKKHWFYADIFIKYLDLLLNMLHPETKVGIYMVMDPDHCDGNVEEYIRKEDEKGRLVLGFIMGGLNSILKV